MGLILVPVCIETLLYKFKAFLDNFIRPGTVVSALEKDDHFATLERIVKSLGVVFGNQRILFAMDKAHTLCSIFANTQHLFLDVHFRNFQP